MGAIFGKLATKTTLDVDNNNKHTTPKHDVQSLSTKEMQNEFDDIYRRSNLILKSLAKNPCKELEERISDCLKDNPLQMSKCFNLMDSYQACVTEDAASVMLDRVAIINEN